MIERMGTLSARYQLGIEAPSPAEQARIVRYYESSAPAALLVREPAYDPTPLAFAPRMLGQPPPPASADYKPPLITHVEIVDLDGDGRNEVLVSDVRAAEVRLIQRAGAAWRESALAKVTVPARLQTCDPDGDGRTDIAVGNLGSILPTEALVGSIVLLCNKGRGCFTARTLAEGLARVSDVRAADLDGDGDQDLLAAAFGAYKTGKVLWLEHVAERWVPHTLLARNGISHVPVGDLDQDGRSDFVALVSQEHEELLLHRNLGGGRFAVELVYRAPHPMFGLSGLELADMEGDGDLDLVFSNGDALDQDPTPKPWHGVRMLENLGRLRFRLRELVLFPGAYSARPGDLDGDGDLDLVVTSMLNEWTDRARKSLIWLENHGALRFAAHALDSSPTFLASADIDDVDGDGRADVVAGGLSILPGALRCGRVTLWQRVGTSR